MRSFMYWHVVSFRNFANDKGVSTKDVGLVAKVGCYSLELLRGWLQGDDGDRKVSQRRSLVQNFLYH